MSGPDLIWAWPWEARPSRGQWSSAQEIVGEGTEYIRRDPAVLAALPEVQAIVAAAFERAAREIDDAGDSAVTQAMGQQLCCSGHMCGCQGADVGSFLQYNIRALTPADASAARDAAIAEAVAKEREACAELAASSTVPSQTAMRLSAAIRKRGEG